MQIDGVSTVSGFPRIFTPIPVLVRMRLIIEKLFEC